jgi:hypothetical protein
MMPKLWSSLLGLLVAQQSFSAPSNQIRNLEPGTKDGTTLVRIPEGNPFVGIDLESIPGLIQDFANSQLEFRIEKHARPEAAESRSVEVFAGLNSNQDDALRYTWQLNGRKLAVILTSAALVLQLDLREITTESARQNGFDSKTQFVIAIMEKVMYTRGRGVTYDGAYKDFDLKIPWPESLDDGVTFSTNPSLDLDRIQAWWDRVDGSVENQVLSIRTYFCVTKFRGFLDGSKWFPDDFRQFVHEKAREQGKLPPQAPKADD